MRPQQPAEEMQTTNSPTPALLVVGSTRFTTPASQQRPRGRRPKELRPRLLSLFCTWVISRRMASRQCGEFDGLPGGSGMDLLHHRHKHRLLGVQVGVRVGFTSPLLVSCAVVVVFIVVLVVLVLVCIDVTAAWGSVATAGIARPHPTPQLRIVIAIVLRPRCIQLLKRLSTRTTHTTRQRWWSCKHSTLRCRLGTAAPTARTAWTARRTSAASSRLLMAPPSDATFRTASCSDEPNSWREMPVAWCASRNTRSTSPASFVSTLYCRLSIFCMYPGRRRTA